jgi:hypothetical protein
MNGYDKAQEMRNVLERLAAKIPGFKGFMERETRREVDALERQAIAGKLADIRQSVLERAGVGGLEGVQGFGEVEKALDGLAQEIRYADYGYTGFFDVAKVFEPQLEQVYAFDLEFCEQVEALAALVETGAPAGELQRKVKEMHKAFGKRKEILVQVVSEVQK